jgi:type II secretory pathway component PulF
MATEKSKSTKDFVFEWEGKDRNGKQVRGETRAVGEHQVQAMLRRQQTQRSRHLHASTRHHDEGRRAAAASL